MSNKGKPGAVQDVFLNAVRQGPEILTSEKER